ncbi:MAG: dihydrolipoyl dehydrogenase [Treponema sp.]|jgi:dihydrolipoamide dehydrogenase|nr:dihydrolipoyl dehydrogenase [Treponema sp.]
MEEQFDVAIIGGGPGGYVCAIRCAQLGKKTLLVESRELGGTCLNRGCIPTKVLLHTAELYDEIRGHGAELGLVSGDLAVDYAALADRKDRIAGKLRRGVEALVKGRKITLVRGAAELRGPKTFRVTPSGNGSGPGQQGGEYTAANLVLAAGSEPASIPVPGAGLPGVLNSDAFLSLRDLPSSAVIVGGGVIGVEFASLLVSLGRKVTILEMLPRILNEADSGVSGEMTRLLKRRGVEIRTGAKLLEIRTAAPEADGLICVYEEGGQQRQAAGAIVIMAVGRRPLTKNLGLEAAGIASERGFITVDDRLRTNVPGVYAVGDLTGKIQLAHAAGAQGLAAAANIAGRDTVMRYDIVPACVYTGPELAWVGMTEDRIIAEGLPYRTGSFPAAANGRSMIMNQTEGFVKILSHRDTGEILGAHIMASRATDLIGEIAAAMRAEATIEELADTIHPHPTVSEMIMEAAHDAEGLCCHKL